ncbi:MAG TPA: hypothetical protein VJR89_15240 [Polyangiales bacterium]|nr:hypothetical protein [Polyangiales bacterium]
MVGTGAALISPEGDIHDFPPWAWPYIRTAAIWNGALSGKIAVEKAQVALKAAVEDCGCSLAASGADLDMVLAAIGTTFDTQYATARLGVVGGNQQAGGTFSGEVDDWCGTGRPKFPWPRPRGLFELLLEERELFGEMIQRSVKLDERETQAVNTALDRQLERFKALEL